MPDATTTDLYEVRVAVSPLREATTGPATFSLCVRNLPSDRGFLVGTGLESALDFLSGFRIGAEDADAFATVRHRPPADLDTLLGLEFTGQVRVVPEGRIVLTGEPLLEVTAPLPQAVRNIRAQPGDLTDRVRHRVEEETWPGRPVISRHSGRVPSGPDRSVRR